MENNDKALKDATNLFATTALEQVIGYFGSDSDIDGDTTDKTFRSELLDGDGEYFAELSAHVMDLGISHHLTPAYVARALAAAHRAIEELTDTISDETDAQLTLCKLQDSIEQDKPTSAAKDILRATRRALEHGIKRAPAR